MVTSIRRLAEQSDPIRRYAVVGFVVAPYLAKLPPTLRRKPEHEVEMLSRHARGHGALCVRRRQWQIGRRSYRRRVKKHAPNNIVELFGTRNGRATRVSQRATRVNHRLEQVMDVPRE
jgi:hypothetical protein